MTFFKLEWWIWNILALDANFEFWKMFWMKSSRKVTQHVSRHILISLQHISLRRLSRVPWLSHAAHQVSQTLYRSKRWLQGRHQNYYYLRLGSNLKFWYLSLLQPALLKDISFRRIGEHSKTCHSSERFASHQFQQLRNFNKCQGLEEYERILNQIRGTRRPTHTFTSHITLLLLLPTSAFQQNVRILPRDRLTMDHHPQGDWNTADLLVAYWQLSNLANCL